MSLRYFMRPAQVMKDGVCKSLFKDSAGQKQQQQARKFSAAAAVIDSGSGKAAAAAVNERFKQAEESLRTVLFLSCWGPN